MLCTLPSSMCMHYLHIFATVLSSRPFIINTSETLFTDAQATLSYHAPSISQTHSGMCEVTGNSSPRLISVVWKVQQCIYMDRMLCYQYQNYKLWQSTQSYSSQTFLVRRKSYSNYFRNDLGVLHFAFSNQLNNISNPDYHIAKLFIVLDRIHEVLYPDRIR